MSRELPEAERAAHNYAEAGWHAFALQPDSKVPFPGTHGFEDATTDHRQIERWWRSEPQSNVGIRTGAPYGPTVLDVDVTGGKPGPASLNKAIRAGLVPQSMALIRTPSGGQHHVYRGDDQPNRVNERTGLDLRSVGGYVAAPGSTVGGKPYVVIHHAPSTATIDYQAISEHLEPERQQERTAWQPSQDGPAKLAHLPGWVAELPEGNRNAGTFWAAVRAAEVNDRTTLTEIARAAVAAGLPSREVAATIRSAQRTAGREASPKAPAPQRDREAG